MESLSESGTALPPAFVERLTGIGSHAGVEVDWSAFEQERATAFRCNSLKTDAGSLRAELESSGFALRPVPGIDGAFAVGGEQRRALTETRANAEGRLFIQNPSSMIPALVLDPQPGEEVLDLAAAPGGKTSHIAALMGNSGRIAAVESSRPRFFRLRSTLEQLGVENADTYLRDGAGVWRVRPEHFDRVLLDAPCTGEGRFTTTDPRPLARWSERKIREMGRRQRRLLYSAVRALRPGGLLVYCTCTFAPEENELVVEWALRRFGCLRLEGIELALASGSAGITRWRKKELDPGLKRALRIWPDGVMEGFFVARLRKAEGAEAQSNRSESPASAERPGAGSKKRSPKALGTTEPL